jgi:DNA-binding MarR family transcriptional regulator
MTDDEYSQVNLASIRTHLQNIEQLVRFDIASNPNGSDAIRKCLAERPGAARVYLALSSRPLGQDEIAVQTGMSQPTVSRICKHLFDGGLILTIRDPKQPRVTLYAHTQLETLLKASRIAKELLNE